MNSKAESRMAVSIQSNFMTSSFGEDMSILNSLPGRPLGRHGPLHVPRLGLGLMGASGVYGRPSGDEERLKFLDQAYERGERFWDTGKAEMRNFAHLVPPIWIHHTKSATSN